MSDIVIRADNLGKRYLIGHQLAKHEQDSTLRDLIMRSANRIRRTATDIMRGRQLVSGDAIEEFWALKDINFEIKKGDRVGIVGRNGAGKSTLLKILSRITEPTMGRVEITGRVASLLEVGTGFHPELTGRENIFLNGSILGMSRKEVTRKFDEIVDFSQVEKFLDTPVKRYSSGMYVRLAFAVAAHLEPETLIVDEVLAVGDAEFQRKCLAKMRNVGEEGRTIIFVSHNLAIIRQLCNRAFVLDGGVVRYSGDQMSAVDFYIQSSRRGADLSNICAEYEEDQNKAFQVVGVTTMGDTGESAPTYSCDEPFKILITCVSRLPVPDLYGYLAIKNREDTIVWESDSKDLPPNRIDRLTPGRYQIEVPISPRSLGRGDYVVYLSFASSQSNGSFLVDTPGNTVTFQLTDTASPRGDLRNGYLSSLLEWRVSNYPIASS